jgi:hypothetical protein
MLFLGPKMGEERNLEDNKGRSEQNLSILTQKIVSKL